MTKTTHAKVVIVGSGPAGYTAAIYAARAMLEPILIQGVQPGGQLTITTDVENYPGFAEVIQGPWLMEQMQGQAEHVGTRIVTDHVNKVELSQRPFKLICDSGDVYLRRVISRRASALARSASEQKFKGYGVSACATCDGFFYRNKEVIVVGGGNTAVEEALFLTNFASKVTVVHRRDAFRAEKILQDRLFKNPKIEVVWDSVLEDVTGVENPLKVSGVKLKNVKTGAVTERKVDEAVFRDRPPAARYSRPGAMKPSGYIVTEGIHGHISAGRIAAGDVTDDIIVRRSPPPGRAAWPRSRRRNSWPRTNTSTRQRNRNMARANKSMDWDKLKVFHAAAEAGSFTHAGERLGLSQSAVSRQVSALESELSVSLFHRHARGLILTEQGELLYRTAHEVFMKLEAARTKLTDSRERPNGELKVSTTPGIGVHWLTPRLGEFLDLYPDIHITLITTDEELDLAMREADVAIRLRQPTQPDLIQRTLFSVHFHAYASPDYLKRFGTPRTHEELDKHRIILLGGNVPAHFANRRWLVEIGRDAKDARTPTLTINNVLGVLRACQRGLGSLCPIILWRKRRSGAAIRRGRHAAMDAYFVYPEELKSVARIQVFRDFLVANAQRWHF
jgi:thioredoxin reductase/DNA-binding transcriptional LysR family regulator